MPCKKCKQNGHNSKTCTAIITQLPSNKECIICYEEVGGENGEVITKCGHKYCTTCFITHTRQKNKCAYCRTEICEKPHSMLPKFSEILEQQIIDNCISNRELHLEIIDDIKRRFGKSVERYGGVCNVQISNYIFDNEISFVYPMTIVSHNVLDIVTELQMRYEEIQRR